MYLVGPRGLTSPRVDWPYPAQHRELGGGALVRHVSYHGRCLHVTQFMGAGAVWVNTSNTAWFLVLSGYIGYADRYLGRGFDLDSIGAVVLGGTSFAGGRGGIGGTIAGVLLLTALVNIVFILNLQVHYQLIVKGAVIIGAVMLYSVKMRSEV